MNATAGKVLDAGDAGCGCVAVNATMGKVLDVGGVCMKDSASIENGDGVVHVVSVEAA